MYLFICFYATGRTLKVHLNIIHVVSFFELMHGWGLLQFLVIINTLSSLLSMLIRHLLCILCYIGIIQYNCYILLFYCYIVWCVYITHCTHISNHCNDLALNGSLIGNKHICICILFHKPVSSTPCNEQDSNLQL